ncbi:MAG: tetratricopeptide repeat protein [Candidatus Micrarchaeia archaeon]
MAIKVEEKYDRCYELASKGDFEGGVKYASDALKEFPNDAVFWCYKGMFSIALGKFKDALECLDNAIKINSNYWLPYTERGIALIALGKLDEAIESLRKSTLKKKDVAKTWFYLGFAYALKKNEKKSNFYLQKALELSPEITVFLYENLAKGAMSTAELPQTEIVRMHKMISDMKKQLSLLKKKEGKK